MADKIEPALTPEEWAGKLVSLGYGDPVLAPCAMDDDETGVGLYDGMLHLSYDQYHAASFGRPEAVIALANAALPDSDPRKITRGKLDYIREVARTQSAAMAHIGEDLVAQRMIEFADALESYLSPEKP